MLQRLFARSVPDPRRDTFKQFRKWTYGTFKDEAAVQEMEAILEADAELITHDLNLVKSLSFLLRMIPHEAIILASSLYHHQKFVSRTLYNHT